MKLRIEEVFDRALAEMNKGRPIDEILKEYPDFAEELKELLSFAQFLDTMPRPAPTEVAITNTIMQVKEMRKKEKAPFIKPLIIFQTPLVRAFAIIVLIVVISGISFSSSLHAMPGEILYPVKTFAEKVQYTLATKPAHRARLKLTFALRRTEELMWIFERKSIVEKNLVSSMLDETDGAFHFALSLPEHEAQDILKHIAEINQTQSLTLEKIKERACACDTVVINEALNKCLKRCQHLEGMLNLQPCPCGGDSCTCW